MDISAIKISKKLCSSSTIYMWAFTTDLLACTWVLHFNVDSGETRVFFFFTLKLFSSVLVFSVLVTTNSSVLVFSFLVTTNSTNLYLVLRYNLGSGLTRVL